MTTRFPVLAVFVFAQAAAAQSLANLWSATVTVKGVNIPFRMEFSGEGSSVTGYFFNGDDKVPSTSGRFDHGALVLEFAHYATELRATLKEGVLEGEYASARRSYAFKARTFAPPPAPPAAVRYMTPTPPP